MDAQHLLHECPPRLAAGGTLGVLLLELAARGYEPVGLDVSSAMQRVTARKLQRRAIAVPQVCGIAQSMPFADECFDSIVCTFPAGYILEAATLREVARVLRRPDLQAGRDGGRLVVTGILVETDAHLWHKAMQLLGGSRAGAVRERFLALAQAADLQVRVAEQGSGMLRVPVFIAARGP